MDPRTSKNNEPITQTIKGVLARFDRSDIVYVPVSPVGCSIEVYRDLMELPIECKVQHMPSCGCAKPDTTVVQEYLGKRYERAIKRNWGAPDDLRTFQWLIHELCDEFDDAVEGGFIAPEQVPDPRCYDQESSDELDLI